MLQALELVSTRSGARGFKYSSKGSSFVDVFGQILALLVIAAS